MPIPKEDHVVTALEIGGIRTRIVSGRVIGAGQREAVLEVELLDTGSLKVVDSITGDHLDGLKVMEVRSTSSSLDLRELKIDGLSLTIGGASSPPVRQTVKPPKSARLFADQAQSPVKVPIADYNRDVWVGKSGYQWARQSWLALQSDTEVELHQVGALQIELFNVDTVPALYDVIVSQEGEVIGSWESVRTRGSLELNEIGEGNYRVLLRYRPKGGSAVLYNAEHTVLPGEVTVVSLDADALVNQQAGMGSLSIEAEIPDDVDPARTPFRIVLWRIEGDALDAPSFDKMLRHLPFNGRTFYARLPELPTGEYLVGVAPCGIQRRVLVEADAPASVRFDLTDLAQVNVWPEGVGDTQVAQLHWRPVDPLAAVGEASATSRELFGMSEFMLRSAPLVGEYWRLSAPPGRIMIVAVDLNGSTVGHPTHFDVEAGANDLVLELSRADGPMLRVDVYGANESQLDEVLHHLHGCFSDERGVEAGTFARRTETSRNAGSHVTYTVHFTSPGRYAVSEMRVGGVQPTVGLPERIDLTEGSVLGFDIRWK